MRLLLDTHVALWAVTTYERLPLSVQNMIADPANDVVVSAVSIWEIAIKHALERPGRTVMPVSGQAALELFQRSGYQMLSVAPAHAAAIDLLPRHHGDPFDRMLIAQALVEPLRLVSHDGVVARYSDAFVVF